MLISNGKTGRRRRKFWPNLAQTPINPPSLRSKSTRRGGGFIARITPDLKGGFLILIPRYFDTSRDPNNAKSQPGRVELSSRYQEISRIPDGSPSPSPSPVNLPQLILKIPSSCLRDLVEIWPAAGEKKLDFGHKMPISNGGNNQKVIPNRPAMCTKVHMHGRKTSGIDRF